MDTRSETVIEDPLVPELGGGTQNRYVEFDDVSEAVPGAAVVVMTHFRLEFADDGGTGKGGGGEAEGGEALVGLRGWKGGLAAEWGQWEGGGL